MEKIRKFLSVTVGILLGCIGLYLVVMFFIGFVITGVIGIIYFLLPAAFLFYISYKNLREDFKRTK